MKRITDISGTICEDMWNYEPPFPKINIKPLPPVPWVKCDVYCEIFEGMHSQTGTYLETPAHYFGNNDPRTYLLIDVGVEKLVDVPCVILNLGIWDMEHDMTRKGVTVADLEACPGACEIREGDAILVSTGWGRYWTHPGYLESSPYFTKAAMDWLISRKPLILGGDLPRWENLDRPQGFFKDFYKSNILMLGPCVNLENISSPRCRLTALPLKAVRTSCAPCRAVIVEELDQESAYIT